MVKLIIHSVLLFFYALLPPTTIHADHKGSPHQQILFLTSYHQTMTWTDEMILAVEKELAPAENDYVLHVEHMDTKRHHNPGYIDSLYRAYKIKYKSKDIDLILTSDNHAFDFLRLHRDELFPGIPVVFGGVNDFKDEQITGFENTTGVAEIIDSAATVDLALMNHPSTKQVFIINDHMKSGRAWENSIRRHLEPFASRVKLSYADNLAINELKQQIALLDKDTIVLIGDYFADRGENYATYEHMGKVLAHVSKVPVYCLLDFNVYEGVVGGKVVSGYSQGLAMAKIAKRILQGESANNIPVLKEGTNRYVFDARQLKRFAIKTSDLPKESIVLNQSPSIFQVNKAALVAFLGILSFVSVFVITLYLELRKRKKAEKAFQESERRFRDIAMSMGDFIWEVDKDGVYQYCSEKIYDCLGYKPAEIIDKTPYDLMTPDAAKETKEFMKENIARRKPFRDFENWNVHKNGDLVCLMTSGTPIIADDGNYMGYRGVDRDITIEKESTAEKLRNKAELKAIINSLVDAIVFADPERHIVVTNPAFSEIFGYQLEEVAGHSTQMIYANPEDFFIMGNERFKVNATGYEPIFNNEYRRKDGTIFTGETISSDVVDENGALLGYLGVIRDVTERKQTADKLEYQQKLLEKSQELGKIGTWVFGVGQNSCQGTHESNRIFGFPADSDMEFKTFLDKVHPDDKDYVVQKWESIYKGHTSDLEYRIIHDNKIKYLREKTELEFNADGDVVKVIGVVQDITEMKSLQEKAIRSAQLASAGTLAAMVAHEVNNPISGVINYAQISLNKTCVDCQNKELMARIVKEGDRIAKIVGGLLKHSYNSGDKKILQGLDPIVVDAINLISHHAEKKAISIKVELPDGLPYINCNAQQIEQVILNIVRNACQALLEGTLDGSNEKIIKICAEAVDIENQKFVQLLIANNGPNIPKELLPRISDPFFTTKPSGEGTGLGLSVSHDIMGNHGGKLEVRSEPGEWTEMIVSFPVGFFNLSDDQ